MEKQNETLEETCLWYVAAKSQLRREKSHGITLDATKGYRDIGCYNCDGLNKECLNFYSSSKQITHLEDSE